jgi:hypothetical protein
MLLVFNMVLLKLNVSRYQVLRKIVFIVLGKLSLHWKFNLKLLLSKKIRSGYYLIWHATIWTIWCSRNKVIFSNGVIDLEEVIDKIKLLAWRWG